METATVGLNLIEVIVPVAEAVSKDNDSLGIVLGGSGQGEQISANKIDGIRAIE